MVGAVRLVHEALFGERVASSQEEDRFAWPGAGDSAQDYPLQGRLFDTARSVTERSSTGVFLSDVMRFPNRVNSKLLTQMKPCRSSPAHPLG